MDIKLKIFLISICLIFSLVIYKKVENKKLQLKYSFPWFLVTFGLIFVTIYDNSLIPLKNSLGFEELSNMIFFGGFVVTIMMMFSLSIKVSDLTTKCTILTQEVALLKKEVEQNGNNKKTAK